MQSKYPSLVLYVITSVIAVISTAIEWEWLTFLIKPIIVPAIFYYYLQRNEFKIEVFFFLGLLSSYASDMIVLLDVENHQVVITLLNMFTYVVMLYYVIHDFSFKNLETQKIVYFFGNLVSFLAVVYIMLTLMSDISTTTLVMYLIYGLVISTLASLAIINHVAAHNLKTFYALIMCICFITTDVFYIVYNFYVNMYVFLLLNLAAQFVSYFYMISYKVTYSTKRNLNDSKRN
ncbi:MULTISPECIES: hypothetical protein [unclassified Flavobacterium]|uniref:hypothetical protein n=1 Tax=unclassified Flavobacterium TaxID=196869 RepID=UPI00360FC9B7